MLLNLQVKIKKQNGDRYSCWIFWTCDKSAVLLLLLLSFSELSSCLYPEGQITWLFHDWKYKDDLRAPQADKTSSVGWWVRACLPSSVWLILRSPQSPALQNCGSRLLPPGNCSLPSEGNISSPFLGHPQATLSGAGAQQGMEALQDLQQLPPCPGEWKQPVQGCTQMLPKESWHRDQCALNWNIFHARNNSNKQKILREIQRCPPKCLCLAELHCVVPPSRRGKTLEELTISCKDSLCKAWENLKDRRHF